MSDAGAERAKALTRRGRPPVTGTATVHRALGELPRRAARGRPGDRLVCGLRARLASRRGRAGRGAQRRPLGSGPQPRRGARRPAAAGGPSASGAPLGFGSAATAKSGSSARSTIARPTRTGALASPPGHLGPGQDESAGSWRRSPTARAWGRMDRFIAPRLCCERGQTSTEYIGLILVVVAIIAAIAFRASPRRSASAPDANRPHPVVSEASLSCASARTRKATNSSRPGTISSGSPMVMVSGDSPRLLPSMVASSRPPSTSR